MSDFDVFRKTDLTGARNKGLEFQQKKKHKTELKREVLVFLGSKKQDITTAQGITLLEEEERRCEQEAARILEAVRKGQSFKSSSKGVLDPRFDASMRSLLYAKRRISVCKKLSEELRNVQTEKAETLTQSKEMAETAQAHFTELNRRFRELNQEVVEGATALRTDIGSLEADIARKKVQLEEFIELIPRLHDRKATLGELIKSMEEYRISPLEDAALEMLKRRDAMLDQQILAATRMHETVARELAFVDAKYSGLRDAVHGEMHSQEELLQARDAAREELDWVKRLPRADKALNVYCSAFTFSYELLSEIGKVVGGDGGGTGGIVVSAVGGLMGVASVMDKSTALKVGVGIAEAAGTGAILSQCKAFDTGALKISLKLGLSYGIGGELGAKTGIAMVYEGGINVQDDRRFRTESTLKVVWSISAEIPELFSAAIKAELLKDTTIFVFKDHYQWAAWLSQKWANIRAWLVACTLYKRSGNRLDQPTPRDLENIRELAEITLSGDAKLRDILDKVARYMEEPIIRVEAREKLGAFSADVDVAETFGLGVEGERTGEPCYYKRRFDPKSKRLWEVQKEGSQRSLTVSAKALSTVSLQFLQVKKHANPDNEGIYLTIGIQLASGTQQTSVMSSKPESVPSSAFGEWIEKNIVPAAESLKHFAPDFLNTFKGPLLSSTFATITSQMSFAQMEIALGQLQVQDEKVWRVFYWRPIFSSGASIDKSIPVYMGLNVDLGGSLNLSRTYREQLGTDTIGYVRTVYHGLINRVRPEDEASNPRPEKARGKALWDAFVEGHKRDLYKLCRRCAVKDSWVSREVKQFTGHEAFLAACARLPEELSELGFGLASKALEAFLEGARKGDYEKDLEKGWSPVELSRFEWSINPYAMVTGIIRTRSAGAKLERAMDSTETERRGLREQIARDAKRNNGSLKEDTSHWIPDEEATHCFKCRVKFSFITRKHHCRRCGGVFCDSCSSHRQAVPERGFHQLVRVCDSCYHLTQNTGNLRQVGENILQSGIGVKNPGSKTLGHSSPQHSSSLGSGDQSHGVTSTSSQHSKIPPKVSSHDLSPSLRMPKVTPGLRLSLAGAEDQTHTLEVFQTTGDGSCGIHAALGNFKPITGEYKHDNPTAIRRQIADRIRDGSAGIPKYEAMISELLQTIDLKVVGKQDLGTDENRLLTQFKKVSNFHNEVAAVRRQQELRYRGLQTARTRIIDRYRALITGPEEEYSLLRQFLIEQILASPSESDRSARTTLSRLSSSAERESTLRGMGPKYLNSVLSANLSMLTEYAGAIESLGGLVHDYRAYAADAGNVTAAFLPMVQRRSTDFRNAYATAVMDAGYYLRSEDMEVLADTQNRSLVIHRRDDRNPQRFINLPVYQPGRSNPVRVFHSGVHWEHANLKTT